MIRIAGILNNDQLPIDPAILTQMSRGMKLHEKDSTCILVEGRVGFTSISLGNGDYSGPDNSLHLFTDGHRMIAFDGRIDNRKELLTDLQTQLSMTSISDETIVLAGYEKWGEDFPAHLIGDFAVAIWDGELQQLVCARDRFGVKPLYYYFNGCFIFSSTPDAILASRKCSPRIDDERIADVIMEFAGEGLEGIDKTSSFFKDIYRLLPAHILVVTKHGMKLQQYWRLSPFIRSGIITEQDYINEFQEIFKESVRCRLWNTPTPSAMLSGGLDSSSITGIGNLILREKSMALNTFSVVSNYPDTNRETQYIHRLLHLDNMQTDLISETELLQDMPNLVSKIESESEPFDCLMNLNRLVYLHAHDRKSNVLLDGVDGDVLLARSNYLVPLWRKGALRTVINETLLAGGLIDQYKLGLRHFVQSCKSAFSSLVPNWIRSIRLQQYYRNLSITSIQKTIIAQDFAQHVQLGERFYKLGSYSLATFATSQIESHKIALEHPYLTVGLERYERVASQMGIEASHPLLDVRLVEFCLGLPWQMKMNHGWTKYILRRAMEPYLPSEVVWRSDKDSLMWEYNRLILRHQAEYFQQVTMDEHEILKPYVDRQKLEKYWQEYLKRGDETNALQLWSGIALAFWLRRHKNMVRDLQLKQ
jgi:asparagine synthase (glutamine-hydrolysing)